MTIRSLHRVVIKRNPMKGVGGFLISSRVDRLRVPVAWRSATDDVTRLLRAISGIGFAAFLIFIQLGFREAFLESSLSLLRAFDGELVLMSATRYQLAEREHFPRQRIFQAKGVRGVASVSPVYMEWENARWKSPADDRTHIVRVVAIDPDRPALVLPRLSAGLDQLREPNSVIMDRRARRILGKIEVGMETELGGRLVRVVGTFTLGPDFFVDGTLVMSEYDLMKFFSESVDPAYRRDQVAFAVISVAPNYEPDEVKAALDRELPGDVSVLTKDELIELESDFQASVSPVGPIFGLGTVVSFFVGFLIAYQILFSEISDRLPQFATLKAIGFGRRYLIGVILRQSLLYCLAGLVLALAMSAAVYWLISAVILLPMRLSVEILAVTTTLIVISCLSAGYLAGRRALTTDPAQVF